MAEIVVSAVMNMLIEKLVSSDLMSLAKSEGIYSQLKKWKKTLPLIQAVLVDAGQKQLTHRAVELWLHELQDLAYDIEDVLDDLASEAMKRKLNKVYDHANTSTSKVLKIIPTCCTSFSPYNIKYGHNMSSKLDEITIKLHDLVEQKNNLGLDVNVNVERSDRTNIRFHQTSLVEESKVLGREGDKEYLLGKLLGVEACNQNVSVVSIVGLGGVGKTTLAKLLYNEEKVKHHFELRAWVCVSDEFDVFSISKAIYQAVVGEDKSFANLDLLHVALKEKLSNKRFLVVLDDVWNEDHMQWELLRSPFVVGAPGSKVIVTTRKTMVASVVNSFHTYNLEVLSSEIAMSLFAQYALDEQNFDKHQSLKQIAQGIIKKCDGLPLALIALGRVLKTKGSDDEWEELLNSEIWNLPDESNILPALKLSYYDLPFHLKQLFAYCSLFPKDSVFSKNKLVLLWMAEGFLSQTNGNKSMESLGCQYFEELKSRSFFQQSTNYKSRYTMHDLMSDLSISVSGEFFFSLDDKMDVNGRNEAFEKFRHFSVLGDRHQVYRKFKELQRARCLRTFLLVSVRLHYYPTLDNVLVQLLPHLQFLRVLRLTNGSVTEVPQSVGRLKHLRYLSFSRTSIKRIPEQISDLYNLQSLLLYGCRELSSLPVSFVKLVNLRHLDISGTTLLTKTPLGIGGLTSLRTLPKVYIEGANGFKLSDLKNLSDLQGQFSIKGLDKVIDPEEATDANLRQKKGLDDLDMEWSDVFNDSRNPTIEYEVLERLKPHYKLKKLTIWYYGGMKFPSWVGDPAFDKLTKLTLHGCGNCEHLPTLGHLSSLQKLYVRSMYGVKRIGFELLAPIKPFYGIAFPALEFLDVCGMSDLETWSTSDGDNEKSARSFPRLLEIHIQQCPKLVEVSIGLIPSLEVLRINTCSEVVLRAMVCVSSSILSLKVRDIKGLTQLHGEVLKHLREVKYLGVSSCLELRYLWESESEACKFLVSLQKLEVISCINLVSLAHKEVHVRGSMESIREVTFSGCERLESYSCPNTVKTLMIRKCSSLSALTFQLQGLPSSPGTVDIPNKCFDFLHHFCLRSLQICDCNNLMSFSHEHLQSLTSLEELEIYGCPSMNYSFPCGLWPPNLMSLRIGCLNKPMSEWGLQNYPASLVNLRLYGKNSGVVSFSVEEDVSNTSLSSFLLPSSLTSLTIQDFMDVESLSEVLQHLTRLDQLDIFSCPNLGDLTDTPSSLRVTLF